MTPSTKTVNIAYYGPGLSGRRTSIRRFYENHPDPLKHVEMRPLSKGIHELEVRVKTQHGVSLSLRTISTACFYNQFKVDFLRPADGVIMMADSQTARHEANIIEWENLKDDLDQAGHPLGSIPVVLQLNKRDLPTALPQDLLVQEILQGYECPVVPSCAASPDAWGVAESINRCLDLILHGTSTA